MFLVISHRALLLGMSHMFMEKLKKDTNKGLSIFVENTVVELKAYILDMRMKIQTYLSHPT